MVKTIGSARDLEEICRRVQLGQRFIASESTQYPLFPTEQRDNAIILDFVETLGNAAIRTIGPELISGRFFDEIRCGVIPEPWVHDIVIVYTICKQLERRLHEAPVPITPPAPLN